MPLRPLPVVVTVLAQGEGGLRCRCLSLQAGSRLRTRQQGQTPASVYPVRSRRLSAAPILLITLALLGAGPVEARCRRAVLEAARAAESPLSLRESLETERDIPERELGADPEGPPPRAARRPGRVSASPAPERPAQATVVAAREVPEEDEGAGARPSAATPAVAPVPASRAAVEPAGGPGHSPESPARALPPPPPPPTYTMAPGETLRTVLTRWADASGWQVVWEASHDYSLSAPARFVGDFREATTRLMESLQSNGAPFGAELYNANRVVRVTRVR
jgi:hypothetical protein